MASSLSPRRLLRLSALRRPSFASLSTAPASETPTTVVIDNTSIPVVLAPIVSAMPPSSREKLLPFIRRREKNKLAARTHVTHATQVLSLLRSFSIPEADISLLLQRYPSVLKLQLPILSAKLLHLRSASFSSEDIGKLLSTGPSFLRFRNDISPNLTLLSGFLPDPSALVRVVCRNPSLLCRDIENNLVPNLRSLAPPEPAVLKLLLAPTALLTHPVRFDQLVLRLREIGFDFVSDPDRASRALRALGHMSDSDWDRKLRLFSDLGLSSEEIVNVFRKRRALRALGRMSDSDWDRKLRLFSDLGLSSEEILNVVRKRPSCFHTSGEILREKVEFFCGCLQWIPSLIARHNFVLSLSLERRVIPRCSVYNVLLSRGVVTTKMPEVKIFQISENDFFEAYVSRYQDRVPEVLDAYHGKLRLLAPDMKCNIEPNLQTLRNYQVPEACIRKLAGSASKGLLANPAHFRAIMSGLRKMEYPFSGRAFVDVINVLGTMPNIVSTAKFDFYRELGWSDAHVFSALKKQPLYVTVPDRNARTIVDFLTRELSWGPDVIANSPGILLLDLERTISPRYSFFKALLSNGCIGRKTKLKPSFFLMGEGRFFKTYVNKYAEDISFEYAHRSQLMGMS